MKKLCFVSISHEKSIVFRAFSSPGGRVSTLTCFPGPGTSFLKFIKFLKILKFLNRLFSKRVESIGS